MTCPACNNPGAYVGFNVVACPDPGCFHHDPAQESIEEQRVMAAFQQALVDEPITLPDWWYP